jgi:hypothetical protein
MSNGAILGVLRRVGYAGRTTGHGFRGVASTILHEHNYDNAHIELQLGTWSVTRPALPTTSPPTCRGAGRRCRPTPIISTICEPEILFTCERPKSIDHSPDNHGFIKDVLVFECTKSRKKATVLMARRDVYISTDARKNLTR